MRFGLAGMALLALAVFSADAPRGQMNPDHAERLGKVCKHYVNRARFKTRHESQDFVVTLADGCSAARTSLSSNNWDERRAATVFLMRLQTLQDLVIDMNMKRVFGAEYSPASRISYESDTQTEAVRKVSDVGEYLIAHRLGLLRVYKAWLDTGPPIALVSD